MNCAIDANFVNDANGVNGATFFVSVFRDDRFTPTDRIRNMILVTSMEHDTKLIGRKIFCYKKYQGNIRNRIPAPGKNL